MKKKMTYSKPVITLLGNAMQIVRSGGNQSFDGQCTRAVKGNSGG